MENFVDDGWRSIYTNDGCIIYVCPHKKNHPAVAPASMGSKVYAHNCDGCCASEEFRYYMNIGMHPKKEKLR